MRIGIGNIKINMARFQILFGCEIIRNIYSIVISSVICSFVLPRRPAFSSVTGYDSTETRACSACRGGTENTCLSCNTDNCNAEKVVTLMKCTHYTWDTDKWVKKMEGTAGAQTEAKDDCKKFEGEKDICKR